jgi:hypothetical protein
VNRAWPRTPRDIPRDIARGYLYARTEEANVIILGIILLLLGLFLKISILWTIGIILLVIGLVLLLVGTTGRAVGGRKHWY